MSFFCYNMCVEQGLRLWKLSALLVVLLLPLLLECTEKGETSADVQPSMLLLFVNVVSL